MEDEELLLIVKPIYGLSDAGDYWYTTLRSFMRDEFGIDKIASDLAFYLQHSDNGIIRMMGTYVDEICIDSDDTFEEISKLVEQRFDSNPSVHGGLHFVGVLVK